MVRLGGHMFYTGLYKEKHETSSCLKPYGLKLWYFGMLHHLVDLYQVLSNYALGDKIALRQVSPGTWSAFNRSIMYALNKTQVGALGPLSSLVIFPPGVDLSHLLFIKGAYDNTRSC